MPDPTILGEEGGHGPSDDYARLLELAETEPVAAIDRWIATMAPGLDHGLGTLLTHERGLERLLKVASRAIQSTPGLIEQASERARLLVRAARSRLGVTTDEPGFMVGEGDAREASSPRELLAGQLVEVVDLNKQAARWTRNVGLQWLVGALLTLQEGRVPPHLAFLPLRLYPGGRYVEQAGAAFREAEDAGLRVTATLRDLIEHDLSVDADLSSLDRQIAPDIWRLYSLIRPGRRTDNVAMRYLGRLSRHRADPAALRAIGAAIAGAVANASITTPSKAAFFRRWRTLGTAWTDEVAKFWLHSQLEDIAAVRLHEGIGDRKFRDAWAAWRSDAGEDALQVLEEERWGGPLRDAIRRALGRDVDPADLSSVGQKADDEPGSTVGFAPAESLEDARLFEEA